MSSMMPQALPQALPAEAEVDSGGWTKGGIGAYVFSDH